MEHSVHGRRNRALFVTGTKKYRGAFGSFIGGVKFGNYNEIGRAHG